jgi:hypothetical protein
MTEWSYVYLGIIIPASVAVPLGLGLARYRETNDALRIILLYLALSGIINIIAAVLAFTQVNNLPLLHFYTIAECLLLLAFYGLLFRRKFVSLLLLVSGILFLVFCLYNFLVLQSLYQFNSYTRPVEAVIIIVLSVIYLYRKSAEDTNVSWARQPSGWIVTGLLLYFSGSLSQFAFSNIISHLASVQTKKIIWLLHGTLVMIMYLLFARAFVLCKR